ncbi:MAG TPA: helix-turn-helix transcriptional regulator [Burkholderiaceae bacterium]|nr:helix-turn-helix transcriptional regulator [Burkholderiaceae bacterium]
MKSLTSQELLCLKWVSMGKTSWETGRILGLAERTINYHVHNACRKLGVSSRQAAVTVAMRTGMLSLEELCVETCRSRPPPCGPRTLVNQAARAHAYAAVNRRKPDP